MKKVYNKKLIENSFKLGYNLAIEDIEEEILIMKTGSLDTNIKINILIKAIRKLRKGESK